MEGKIEFNIVFAPVVEDYIEKAIDTLYKHTDPEIFRVILVDQTMEGLYTKLKDKIHVYVRTKRPNLGFAQGMNTGWRLSEAPYTICSNDDIEFMDKRWWGGIKEVFNDQPDCIAVGPMSPAEAGWGYGLGSNPDFVCPDWGLVDGDLIVPKKADGTGFTYKEEFTSEDYDWLLQYRGGHIEGMATWFPVFKKEAKEKIGLFDERFYPGGGEDYDWVARCYSAGYRAISTSKSWVWHHWSKSLKYKGVIPPRDREGFGDVDSLWEVDENAPRNPIYHTPPRKRKFPKIETVDY